MSVEPVRVELGYDRFEAIAIANEAKARGYKVELLLMDSNGLAPGLSALEPHVLLSLPDQAEAVSEIAESSWRDYVEWEGRIEDLPRYTPMLMQMAAALAAAIVVVSILAVLFV